MKALKRNQTKLQYSLFIKEVENTDADGNLTGEKSPEYSDKKDFKCNISPNRGEDVTAQFGANIKYDRILSGCEKIEFDENTLFYIGKETYRVVRISINLNSFAIAIERIDIS